MKKLINKAQNGINLDLSTMSNRDVRRALKNSDRNMSLAQRREAARQLRKGYNNGTFGADGKLSKLSNLESRNDLSYVFKLNTPELQGPLEEEVDPEVLAQNDKLVEQYRPQAQLYKKMQSDQGFLNASANKNWTKYRQNAIQDFGMDQNVSDYDVYNRVLQHQKDNGIKLQDGLYGKATRGYGTTYDEWGRRLVQKPNNSSAKTTNFYDSTKQMSAEDRYSMYDENNPYKYMGNNYFYVGSHKTGDSETPMFTNSNGDKFFLSNDQMTAVPSYGTFSYGDGKYKYRMNGMSATDWSSLRNKFYDYYDKWNSKPSLQYTGDKYAKGNSYGEQLNDYLNQDKVKNYETQRESAWKDYLTASSKAGILLKLGGKLISRSNGK